MRDNYPRLNSFVGLLQLNLLLGTSRERKLVSSSTRIQENLTVVNFLFFF